MRRYIDADKLIEFANNTKDKTIDANDIARFPAADVRENVRGEWLHISDGYYDFLKCSQCGKTTDSQSNYCPNCGAEMMK